MSFLTVAALAVGAVALESHAAPDRRALWRAARLNLGYYLSVMTLVTPVVVLATPAIVAAVNRLGGGLIRLPSAGAWFWLSVLVVLLATDLLDYLYHRTEHAVPFLWRLHALRTLLLRQPLRLGIGRLHRAWHRILGERHRAAGIYRRT